jgi:hypothetical protein
MADAADSKSVARKGVWVQVPPPALLIRHGRHDRSTPAGQAVVGAPPTADRRLLPRRARFHEAFRLELAAPC